MTSLVLIKTINTFKSLFYKIILTRVKNLVSETAPDYP